jgi:hypothetical protein
MKYLVSYDYRPNEEWPVVLWDPKAGDEEGMLYLDEDGNWACKNPMFLIDEMAVREFEEKHGKLKLKPGETGLIKTVVHWIVEEEE